MRIIYDIAFLLFAVLYLPYILIKSKWHGRFNERLGFFSEKLKKELSQLKSPIWLHAVSVGEVAAVVQLVKRLRKEFPKNDILVTTVTATGQELAVNKMPEGTVCLYSPLDASWIGRKFINIIKPSVYIAAETEIWPNLYFALNTKGVNILQINGRISDKAFKGYKKIKFLLKPVLNYVTCFSVQSDLDKERLIELGARDDRIAVNGNLKFDIIPGQINKSSAIFNFKREAIPIIAGSTHPGEEAMLLNIYRDLRRYNDNVRLIIAPRHIERSKDVASLVTNYGWRAALFSERLFNLEPDEILIMDKIGYLIDCYTAAEIVFIGKTFCVGGGQNMIEPAACGKATIVGPHTENFKDAMRLLLQAQGIIQVPDQASLKMQIEKLVNNPELREKIGDAGKQCIVNNKGSTEKTITLIKKWFDNKELI